MSNLSNSNSNEDRRYLIAVKTEYKLLEQKFTTARDELKKWNDRIILAKQKKMINLQAEAEKKAETIQNRIKYLTEELIKLKVEAERIIETAKTSPEKLSLDPGELLNNLKNLIGDDTPFELEKGIRNIKVDNELEKIKREMDSGNN